MRFLRENLFLVIVVAVIGFALQHAGLGMKGKKKPEPAKA
jgi:hypothetical protein